MSTLFRKKPVTIEAVRFDGRNYKEVFDFTRGNARAVNMSLVLKPSMDIATLEGVMRATEGDWIIKGVRGEFYPCKPDMFAATYEEVQS